MAYGWWWGGGKQIAESDDGGAASLFDLSMENLYVGGD